MQKEYVMGVDSHGYDGRVFTAIVMTTDKEVVRQIRDTDKSNFEQEVALAASYYNIPKENILWEEKK